MREQITLFGESEFSNQTNKNQVRRTKVTDTWKSNYNSSNYTKNKEKILAQAKQRYQAKKSEELNVYSLFLPPVAPDTHSPEMDPESKTKLEVKAESVTNLKPGEGNLSQKINKFTWSTLFLQIFVISISLFLISEATEFYALSTSNRLVALLQACLLEGAVIAFSLMKARTALISGFQAIRV
jgi:hypothetical protein